VFGRIRAGVIESPHRGSASSADRFWGGAVLAAERRAVELRAGRIEQACDVTGSVSSTAARRSAAEPEIEPTSDITNSSAAELAATRFIPIGDALADHDSPQSPRR
jgi:hypothetical protein